MWFYYKFRKRVQQLLNKFRKSSPTVPEKFPNSSKRVPQKFQTSSKQITPQFPNSSRTIPQQFPKRSTTVSSKVQKKFPNKTNVSPVFSKAGIASSADHDRRIKRRAARSMIKAAGFIDVGILASVIYKKGVHEPWMCILIYSRVSGKAQRPNRHLATQFLPLIKDVTAREICAQHSAGRFSEIVLVLIECVGLSPGYQLVVALNETYLTYKDLRQLAMLLPKRKAAL